MSSAKAPRAAVGTRSLWKPFQQERLGGFPGIVGNMGRDIDERFYSALAWRLC
jgi:hypothetical protein